MECSRTDQGQALDLAPSYKRSRQDARLWPGSLIFLGVLMPGSDMRLIFFRVYPNHTPNAVPSTTISQPNYVIRLKFLS